MSAYQDYIDINGYPETQKIANVDFCLKLQEQSLILAKETQDAYAKTVYTKTESDRRFLPSFEANYNTKVSNAYFYILQLP